AFYSLQDTVTPVKIGLLTVATNTALSLALLRWTNLSHGGLALAFSAAAIVQMAAQLMLLRPKLGGRLDIRAIAGTFARAAVGSALMFPAVQAAAQLAGAYVDLTLTSGRLAQVLAGIAAGVAVYGLVAVVLRMEELQLVLSTFRRMARRSS
ncbi:MAG: hypothetical protein DIU82_05210, partial [Bacillota bacterium]